MAKKLGDVFRNRKQILEGLTNSIFKKDHIEKIAAERLEICIDCSRFDPEGARCMIPGTQPCCSECGCKLSLKTRSLSSECPHPDGPRWEAILVQEEEDKLYKEINYDPDAPK
jgi:hypothetical protein